ncbi:glycosyltransferase family 39 protein [Streptomyces sp. NPDC004749]
MPAQPPPSTLRPHAPRPTRPRDARPARAPVLRTPGTRPVRAHRPRSVRAPDRRTGRDPRYWRGLLPVLALLVLVTRLPSLRHPLWNPDEGYLAVQARILADGGALYETVVDRKPPLLPWLYQAALLLFGGGFPYAVKALAALAVLATAALLAAVARDRWGDRAGRVAGVLYPPVSIGLNPEDTQAATFEVFILPFTAAAVWCAGRGRWGAAGLAAAGAVLTKQTGGAVLVPVLWLLFRPSPSRTAPRGRPVPALGHGAGRPPAGPEQRAGGRPAPRFASRGRDTARLLAGLVLPVLAAALLTSPSGFLFWTVTGSGAYAAFTGSELHVLARGLANTALLCLACAGLLPHVLRACSRPPRATGPGTDGTGGPWDPEANPRRAAALAGPGVADLRLWLGASATAVLAGFHFFGHYFLQLLPPLVLLATAALHRLPADRIASAVLTTACAGGVFLAWGLLAPRPELGHAQRLADAVRARTAATDRILVWGMHPETYWLADRAPASRYLTAGLLTNYSGGRDGPQVGEEYAVPGTWPVLAAELRDRPPALIVDDSRGKPFAPDRLPTLRALLALHYEPLPGTVDGAVLYARSSEGPPAPGVPGSPGALGASGVSGPPAVPAPSAGPAASAAPASASPSASPSTGPGR